MLALKFLGVLAIIPATMLLVVSFFVLVVVNRIKEEGLKSFGRIIAMLLWVASLLVFLLGIYGMATGYCPIVKMLGSCGIPGAHREMMYERMQKRMGREMPHGMMYRHMEESVEE